jgi:hypothetical protein
MYIFKQVIRIRVFFYLLNCISIANIQIQFSNGDCYQVINC